MAQTQRLKESNFAVRAEWKKPCPTAA